jgi:hypothetical protein
MNKPENAGNKFQFACLNAISYICGYYGIYFFLLRCMMILHVIFKVDF